MKYKVRDGQEPMTLRQKAYPREREQLGAFAKMLRVVVDNLPPDVRKKIPAEALAVLAEVEAVKIKYPKGR